MRHDATHDLGELVVGLGDGATEDAHETKVVQVTQKHTPGLRVDETVTPEPPETSADDGMSVRVRVGARQAWAHHWNEVMASAIIQRNNKLKAFFRRTRPE